MKNMNNRARAIAVSKAAEEQRTLYARVATLSLISLIITLLLISL